MIRGVQQRSVGMNLGNHVRRLAYHGRVQGVGFRATTVHLARGFAVTGYVRNQSDGTVEVAVEGDRGEVERFLASISSRFSTNITKIEESCEAQPIEGKGFVVLP